MTSTFLGLPRAVDTGHLHGDQPFPALARVALADTQLRRNLGQATATIRAKRAAVVAEVPDWPALRAAGAAIKDATLAGLDRHLERLEAEVTARGGHRAAVGRPAEPRDAPQGRGAAGALSGWRDSPTGRRARCLMARSSGSRSRARSPPSRRCCCSTSRPPAATRSRPPRSTP